MTKSTTPRMLCWLGALALCASADAWPQVVQAPAAFPEDYLLLLDSCRRGEPAAQRLAHEALAAWTGERLIAALAGLRDDRSQAAADPLLSARTDDRMLSFAAIAHTELAFGQMNLRQETPARAHLDMARGLLALLPEDVPPPGLKRRWYLAVGCRYRRDFELDEARRWLRQGLEAFPQAASLRLALGSADEIMATFRNVVCPSAAECPGGRARERYLAVEWDRQVLATSAEQHYRQALEAEPELLEARLRLGRLLWRHASKERGLAGLRRAAEQAAQGDLAYLAHLFLGAALQDHGSSADAIAHYRAALGLREDGQAARLALAHALRLAGDRGGERETLLPLFDPPGSDAAREPRMDPWWLYASGPQECGDSQWRALRAEVGR